MKIKEKFEEIKVKTKTWCSEHERDIRDITWYMLGGTVVYIGGQIGLKIDARRMKKKADLDPAGNYQVYRIDPVPDMGIKRPWLACMDKDDANRLDED